MHYRQSIFRLGHIFKQVSSTNAIVQACSLNESSSAFLSIKTPPVSSLTVFRRILAAQSLSQTRRFAIKRCTVKPTLHLFNETRKVHRWKAYLNEERMIIRGRGSSNADHPNLPSQVGAVLNVQLVEGLNVFRGEADGYNDSMLLTETRKPPQSACYVLPHPAPQVQLRLPHQPVGQREIQFLHHRMNCCRYLLGSHTWAQHGLVDITIWMSGNKNSPGCKGHHDSQSALEESEHWRE